MPFKVPEDTWLLLLSRCPWEERGGEARPGLNGLGCEVLPGDGGGHLTAAHEVSTQHFSTGLHWVWYNTRGPHLVLRKEPQGSSPYQTPISGLLQSWVNYKRSPTLEIPWSCSFYCSVAQSCLTLCDSINCGMPGFPVLHSQSLFKLMSVVSVMPSNHLILCHPLLQLPSIFPHIRVFVVFWQDSWICSLNPAYSDVGGPQLTIT